MKSSNYLLRLSGFQDVGGLWEIKKGQGRGYTLLATILYLAILIGFGTIGYVALPAMFSAIGATNLAPAALVTLGILGFFLFTILLRVFTRVDWNQAFFKVINKIKGDNKTIPKELRSPIFQMATFFAFVANDTIFIHKAENKIRSRYNTPETSVKTKYPTENGEEINRIKRQVSRHGGFFAYGIMGFFFSFAVFNSISLLIDQSASLLVVGGAPLIISIFLALIIGWAAGHRNYLGSLTMNDYGLVYDSLVSQKNSLRRQENHGLSGMDTFFLTKKEKGVIPTFKRLASLLSSLALGTVVFAGYLTSIGLVAIWAFKGGSFANLFSLHANDVISFFTSPQALGVGIIFFIVGLMVSIAAAKGWYTVTTYYDQKSWVEENIKKLKSNFGFYKLICVSQGIVTEDRLNSIADQGEKEAPPTKGQKVFGYFGAFLGVLAVLSLGASLSMGVSDLLFSGSQVTIANANLEYWLVFAAVALLVSSAAMNFYGKSQYDTFSDFYGSIFGTGGGNKNPNKIDKQNTGPAKGSTYNKDQETRKFWFTTTVNALANGITSFAGLASLSLATHSPALLGVAIFAAVLSTIASFCANMTTAPKSKDQFGETNQTTSRSILEWFGCIYTNQYNPTANSDQANNGANEKKIHHTRI